MSSEVAAAYPDEPDESQTHTLVDYLEQDDDHDILAHGWTQEETLTPRDRDRVRILKFIANHPQGVTHTSITAHCLKGIRPSHCELTTTKDSDHRFVKRFLNDLARHDPELVENHQQAGTHTAVPTLSLIDLISYGVSETVDKTPIHDREFCKTLLANVRGADMELSRAQKDLLADSFSKYLDRIDDYRLLFDVNLSRGGKSETRRMTKNYATRFSDQGRLNKSFAKLQQALEHEKEHGDTAVFSTLTTWPRLQDNLLDAIESINPAFHNLTQWLKSDPDTVADTRKTDVPQWRPGLDSSNFHFGASGAVSGRPREQLDYLKVLEFTQKGYPHLHTLFMDPPGRESDGMPWLVDKNELSDRWEQYGMAKVVDLYPLIYRDDLRPEGPRADDRDGGLPDLIPDTDTDLEQLLEDEINDLVADTVTEWYRDEHLDGARFNASTGFVCWYQHGNHSHTDEWIADKTRYHKQDGLIDMAGDEEQPMQKTAGSYLGKYISKTYGSLMNSESLEKEGDEWDHSGDAPPWKLALYWTTERQLWSMSQDLNQEIERDLELPPEVRSTVNWCARDTLLRLTDRAIPQGGDLPDLDLDRTESALHEIVRETIATIDFLGAYPIWDLPGHSLNVQNVKDVAAADADPDDSDGVILYTRGDRPPPVAEVW